MAPPPMQRGGGAFAAEATDIVAAPARARKRKQQRDLAPLASAKRTDRAQPAPSPPSKQRIRTSQLRKVAYHRAHSQEIELLQSETASLEAKLDFYKHRARIIDPSAGLDQQVLNNALLREMLRNQQFLIAGLRSVMSADTSEHVCSPVSSTIHLGTDPEIRRAQMLAMKPHKLHDARRFLENRTRFVDPMRPFSEATHFETREGDTCVVKFDSIPFPEATSVKQVFDALTFYCFNLEICTAEIKGAVVVREEADPGDESVSHNRLVYPKACSISVETNNIVFAEYTRSPSESQQDSAEGLVTTDFVDHDEMYPYRLRERIREDVTSIFMVQRRRPSHSSPQHTPSTDDDCEKEYQPVVVLTRWVQAKLHHCEELSLPDDTLNELREEMNHINDAIVTAVRGALRPRKRLQYRP